MNLDDVISLAKQQSREIVDSGEGHIPLILILTSSDLVLAKPVFTDKDAFRSALIKLLMTLDASAYVFISEAWSAKISKDSPWLNRLTSGELRVSELPLDDREEILTITAVDNGESYRCWTAKIDYNPRCLGEWKMMPEGAKVSGRLVVKEW